MRTSVFSNLTKVLNSNSDLGMQHFYGFHMTREIMFRNCVQIMLVYMKKKIIFIGTWKRKDK